jgi:5-methyltetrahydropteroyltriglutamate--homocysteine methyltransferase
MVIAANLGFPRIGAQRELKKAVEAYWKGQMSAMELEQVAADLRREHWTLQHRAGIKHIPSNDFSYYDQVLDTIAFTGAVPERYQFNGLAVDLDTYFAMARGVQRDGLDVPAMEMTKWFDTNYHYLVPEFHAGQQFALKTLKAVNHFLEAKAQGLQTRPVILGPVSFLLLGKMKEGQGSSLDLLPALLPVYVDLLQRLAEAGADWVQMDEPCLVLDLSAEAKQALVEAYRVLGDVSPKLHLMLATYFGALEDNLDTALQLNVGGLHIDLVRAPEQLDTILAKWQGKRALSLGVVDGRNIWRNNLSQSLKMVEKAVQKVGTEWVHVSPSCSLQHVPVDLDNETALDAELKSWLCFAKQKLAEVAIIAKGASETRSSITSELQANEALLRQRAAAPRLNNKAVQDRVSHATAAMATRHSVFAKREEIQQAALQLPLLPTTTIGSFPQTAEVRKARADFKKGVMSEKSYTDFLRAETKKCVELQEEIGLDMLVHGEFERNDMVEYFGEQLAGFAFTQNGWVQSYGSRCVKPPVIFGDVERTAPMTVEWAEFAQSLTKRPMKGMLTGPVTILQWSFVRNDQPEETTCRQIAFAIRDEVQDLEAAGIQAIQVDEPAFREGLPLRQRHHEAYLNWASECFRLSTCGVKDSTQIHTHMCYSEFNNIIAAIAGMDADVISIETSRSQMELLDAFTHFNYPNQIGPGVYDIHSPRVPDAAEMADLLRKALKVLDAKQIWVNPDCGLKTRGWKETTPALVAMVNATRLLRKEWEQQRKAS